MSSPPPGTVQFDVKFNTQAALAAWNGFVQSVITSGAGVKAVADTSAQGFEATQKAIIELQKSQAAQAQEMLKASQEVMAALQKETVQREETSTRRQAASKKEIQAEQDAAYYAAKKAEAIAAAAKVQQEAQTVAQQALTREQELIVKANQYAKAIAEEIAYVQELKRAREQTVADKDVTGYKAVNEAISASKQTIQDYQKSYEQLIIAIERTRQAEQQAAEQSLASKQKEVAAQAQVTSSAEAQVKSSNEVAQAQERNAKATSSVIDAKGRMNKVEDEGAKAATEYAKKRAAATEDEVRSIKRLEDELKQLKYWLSQATNPKEKGLLQGAIGAAQAELNAAKGGLSDYKSKAEELLATIKGGGNTIGSFIQAIGKAGLVSSETGGRLSVLAEAIGASGVSIDGLISGVTSLASGLGAAAGPIGAAVALVIALGTALVKAAEAIYEADIAMISYLKSAAGETAKFQSTLAQLSQVTGATREQIAAITMGLQKFGLNAMTAGVMLERLTGKAVESAKGNKQAAEAFHAFGISVVDANKQIKDAGTLFEELAQQTQGLVLDFRQKEALVELFGLRGVKAFEVARAGYANYIKAVREFNIILTAEQEENLNKYREAAAKLEIVNKGITQSFGVAGSEGIAKLIDQYLNLLQATEITSEGMHQLVDAFLELNSEAFAVIISSAKTVSENFLTLFNIANQILNLGFAEEVTSWSDVFKKFADDLRYTAEIIKSLRDTFGIVSYSQKMAEAADEIVDKTDKANTQIAVSVRNREAVIETLVKQRVLTEKEAAAQIKEIQDKANADSLANLEKRRDALKDLLRDANAKESVDPGSVNPEKLQALRKQYAQSLTDIEKFKEGIEKLNHVVDEHNKSVLSAANDVAEMAKAYTEANAAITESTKARVEEVKGAVADGTKSEIEGAQEVAEMHKQADDEILSNLEDRLAKAQAALDAANADPGSYTQEIIDKLNEEAKAAAVAIEKQKTEALRQGNEDRRAIEKAYAKELERDRKEEFAKLETQAKAEIALIQEKEKSHQISHSQSVKAQYEQSVAALEQKKALLEADLQNEKISVEEKNKLKEEANKLDTQLEEARIKLKADSRQAEIADEADKIAKIQALNNQENAKLEIALRQKEQQLRQAGADELTIQMELGKMKEAGLQRELENLNLIIEAKKAQAVPENELLDLETQRLQLVDKIKQAHDAATGALIDGAKRAKDAIDEVANEAKEAAEKAKAAQEASVGGMISWIANLKNEASKATKENIDEYVDYFQKRLTEAAGSAAALGAGQIAGLLDYYAQEAVKAMDEVLKRQREIQREENEKQRAEREAAAKQLAESLQSIRDRELSAIENANKRLRDAEKAHRKGMEDAQKDLADKKVEINKKADDDLVKLNQDRLDREKEAEEKAVEDSLRRERERLRSIADLQQQANDDYLSSSFDLLDQEVELESRRAEISGKAKAGDPEAIAQQKEIDGQLATIQRKRKDEEKHQADIQKVLKSGKSKEEIEAEVAKLNEQFQANQEYQERLAKYEAEGNTEAIKRLKELHAQQVESINAKYAEQERQRIEDARLEAEAIAKQKEDDRLAYEEQKAEIERRRAKDLADAQTDFDNKAKQLDDNLKKARNQHDRALADIKSDTQKALDDLKVSWDDYFKFIETGIARISRAATDAQGTLSNLSPGSGGGTGGGARTGGSSTTYDVNTGQGAQPGGTPPGGGTGTDTGGQTGGRPNDPNRQRGQNRNELQTELDTVLNAFEDGSISFDQAIDTALQITRDSKYKNKGSEYSDFLSELKGIQKTRFDAAIKEASDTGKNIYDLDLKSIIGDKYAPTTGEIATFIDEANVVGASSAATWIREVESGTSSPESALENLRIQYEQGTLGEREYDLAVRRINAIKDARAAKEGTAGGGGGTGTTGTNENQNGGGRFQEGGETGTTPATEGELTTTEPKVERDPKLFNNLMLDIQRMTSREEADAILAKASLAAEKGSLDSSDLGKIKSHVDYYAFLRGFDIGNKAPTGQHGGKVEGPGETATHQPPETPALSGVTQDKGLALPQGAAATGEDLARQIFDAVSKGQLTPIEGLAELDKLLAGKKITPEVHTQYVERINRLAQTATQTAIAKPAVAPGTTGTASASGAATGSPQAGTAGAPPPVTQPIAQTDTNLDLKLSDGELPPSVQRLVEAYEDGKLAFDPAIGEYETAVGLIRQLVAGGQLSDADALRAVKALQAARDAKKRKLEAALQQQASASSPEPTAAQKPRFVGGGAFPVVNRPGGPAAGQPAGETASLVANMTKGDMSILINVEKAHTIQEIMAAIEAKAKTDMAKKGVPVA